MIYQSVQSVERISKISDRKIKREKKEETEKRTRTRTNQRGERRYRERKAEETTDTTFQRTRKIFRGTPNRSNSENSDSRMCHRLNGEQWNATSNRTMTIVENQQRLLQQHQS